MHSIEWLCCRWPWVTLTTLNRLNIYILRCLMHLRNKGSQKLQMWRTGWMCKSQPTDDKPYLIEVWSGHVTHLQFWGSNHITGTADPKVVNFCTHVGYINSSNRMTYHPQNGCGYGHVTVLKFCCLLWCSASCGFVSDSWATCTYVRPLSEFACHVWSPKCRYLIDKVESVQRFFFTGKLHGLSNLSYPDRLYALDLETVQHRRLIHDLIFCYKYLHDLIDANNRTFWCVQLSPRTRNNGMKLYKANEPNWLDLGRRLACLPACPSARLACTRAPRKPRTVPPPLPSPAPAAGLRTSSDCPSIQATPVLTHRDSPIVIYRL